MTLMVRTDADPAALAAAIRNEVWTVDKDVPLADIQPLAQVVSESISRPRATMLLLAVFAGVAMLLGSIGIYGVVAYAVAQRTQEIGIRMALGASSRDVLRMEIGQGMRLILTGMVLGIGGALAATRALESLLFGVSATDALTFAVVALLLALVALLACWIPARRAARVDPMVALRYE
jgi:putative ABC transport system permease protein